MTKRKKANDHEIPTLSELGAENTITRKKVNNHEKPILTRLEAENIIARKKVKDREKPGFTSVEAENMDTGSRKIKADPGDGSRDRCRSGIPERT